MSKAISRGVTFRYVPFFIFCVPTSGYGHGGGINYPSASRSHCKPFILTYGGRYPFCTGHRLSERALVDKESSLFFIIATESNVAPKSE